MQVNSHNEWDKLKEVIVGTAEGISATLEWGSPKPIPEPIKEKALVLAREASPQWFVEEIMEDLDGLIAVIFTRLCWLKRS